MAATLPFYTFSLFISGERRLNLSVYTNTVVYIYYNTCLVKRREALPLIQPAEAETLSLSLSPLPEHLITPTKLCGGGNEANLPSESGNSKGGFHQSLVLVSLMLATQLLRILQTIPGDVECETCECDSATQDMIMKQNQNGTHYDSKILGVDDGGLKKDSHLSLFEAKSTEGYWNTKLINDLSMDNKAEEFQNGPFCRLDSMEDDIDSVSSDRNAKGKVQTRPEHDHAVEGREFMHFNDIGTSDCRLPYIAATDLFGRDKNMYTDEHVLDYDRPELIVCYKEINYHVVKDICVDEGMPANRKILMDDDQSGNFFPGSLNDNGHCKATGGVGDELVISNGLAAASLDSAEFIVANPQGSEKGSSGVLLALRRPELPSEERLLEKDTATNLEESSENDSMNVGATSKAATGASDEGSFVDKTLPIQEFGTRSFLRSFLNSLDDKESEAQQLPDQLSSGKVVSEGPTATMEAKPKEDVKASILNYNSEVETRSITFNFNSLAPVVGDGTNGKNGAEAQSASSNDVNIVNALDHSLDCKNEKSSADSHALQHEDRDTDNGPVASLRRYDHGEASFSADDFITHSGPLPFSGTLSLCSDGSATSGRSFAFPELQSEWNSSPVRMTDAERRRFRRHRGWRSGLLCCRF